MIPTTNVWGTKWFFDIQKLNTEDSDVSKMILIFILLQYGRKKNAHKFRII